MCRSLISASRCSLLVAAYVLGLSPGNPHRVISDISRSSSWDGLRVLPQSLTARSLICGTTSSIERARVELPQRCILSRLRRHASLHNDPTNEFPKLERLRQLLAWILSAHSAHLPASPNHNRGQAARPRLHLGLHQTHWSSSSMACGLHLLFRSHLNREIDIDGEGGRARS